MARLYFFEQEFLMKTNIFAVVFTMVLVFSMAACNKEQPAKTPGATATATQAFITILAPKDGAVLNSGTENKLQYNVHLSPTGNHLHIYIDNQKPIISRDVSHCPCGIDLPDLVPGKHVITIKEATSAHVLTGLQRAVTVTVQ